SSKVRPAGHVMNDVLNPFIHSQAGMKAFKNSRLGTISILCLALAATTFAARAADPPTVASDQTLAADEHPSPQRRGGFGQAQRGVYKARITPHWFQDNTRFWYTNGLPGGNWE